MMSWGFIWMQYFSWQAISSLLPHNATWDNTLYHTHKLKTLSKISLEYIWVSIVTGIDIQYISPWCLDPLGRYWDKLENKRFYATSFPKILYTIHPFLSLNHKSVCFTLPLFNKDRVQFEFNAIYFFSLPSSEGKDVIVERIVSELQVRSVGWSERWFIKWVVTSSIHEPPQK